MKNIILLLSLITTINFAANPFDNLGTNSQITQEPTSEKYFYAKRAADRGDARAQFDLALMYVEGNGVIKNKRMAFNLLHKAARKNHTEAKFYMGLSFLNGIGVKKQAQLARYWFKLAAKAGHSKAMAHLASVENSLRPQYTQNRRVAFNSFK